MNLYDQITRKWDTSPVDIADLDKIMARIEELWKQSFEALGPCLLAVENGQEGYAQLSSCFGSAVSLRLNSALYRAHIDNLSTMPIPLANSSCFSMIRAGLHDQGRSRGLFNEKLQQLLSMGAENLKRWQETFAEVDQRFEEVELLTKLFRTGLEDVWKQLYMPE